MAAGRGLVGQDVQMTVGGATLLGVVTKNISVSNSEIDVTDDQSSGNRELLAKGGVQSAELTVEGIVKNYELLATMDSSTQMVAVSVDLGDATTSSTYAFDALMTSLEFGFPTSEGATFSATLLSSGALTFTAGS